MNTTLFDERTLTELDHVRISRLLQRSARAPLEAAPLPGTPLREVLEQADLVSSQEVPADIVTMYSRVTVEDTRDGQQRTLTLCYPEDADAAAGFVSVLSPIGAALLGRRVGEVATPASPAGDAAPLRLVEILFQPEASGDFTL